MGQSLHSYIPSYLSAGACETILDFSSKYFLSAALVTEKGKYIFHSVTMKNNTGRMPLIILHLWRYFCVKDTGHRANKITGSLN